MIYRSEIDGLRALAVLPVIFFHAGFDLFSGGYVGVDVFFVISGFLITSIILQDLGTGRFFLAAFYERRARRILPALFLVLTCTTIAGLAWMSPAQFEEYSRALTAVVLFVSNIYFWRSEDYFAPVAELNPLLHTWSLGVEEQFYIFFPLLLLAIWRFGGGRVAWTVAALSLASLLLAEWGWRNRPGPNFFLLPTRAWELGAGSICAFVLRGAPPRANALLSSVGIGMICYSVFAFDGETPFPSIYALVPVGGACLVIVYGQAGTLVARLLSIPLVVSIGLISYSAYLWHQPLFAFARLRSLTHPSAELMLVLALAALVLAYFSWRFVEQPFRRRPHPVPASRGAAFAVSGAAAAVLVGIGIYGQATQGRMEAWTAANPDSAHVYGMHQAATRLEGVYLDDGACQFNAPRLDGATIERLRDCRRRHGPGVAILGDSHAIDVFNGMDAHHEGEFIFGMTFAGCWMDAERRNSCDFDGFASMLRDDPGLFDQLIYHQAGYRFLSAPEGLTARDVIQRIPEYGELPPNGFGILGERIDRGLDYLAEISRLTDVTWVGPRIEPHIGLNYMLNGGCDHPYTLRGGQSALFTDLDRHLAAAAAADGVEYVSLIDAARFDMPTDFIDCERLYWSDGDHWSEEGARRFIGRLLEGRPSLRAGAGDAINFSQ